MLGHTTRLKVLIAHRPGFVAPSLVARKLITLDHLTGGGRVAIHHITGGDEADQRREGDRLGHDERYRRTAEFMTVLRAVLTSEPVDFEGEFYSFTGAPAGSARRPRSRCTSAARRTPRSGAGPQRRRVHAVGRAARQIAERIVRCGTRPPGGREVSFSLSVRPILGDTEAEAWARAAGSSPPPPSESAPVDQVAVRRPREARAEAPQHVSVGGQRLRAQAAEALVHDDRLWYGVAG